MSCRCWSVCTCTPVRDASVLTEQQGRQMGGGSGYPQYSLGSSNRTTSNPEHHFHPLARTHNMAMHSLTRAESRMISDAHTVQQHIIIQFLQARSRTAGGQNQRPISCIKHWASIMTKMTELAELRRRYLESNDFHFVMKDTHTGLEITTVFGFLDQLYHHSGQIVNTFRLKPKCLF